MKIIARSKHEKQLKYKIWLEKKIEAWLRELPKVQFVN
jgi:hypothetical protein